MKEKEKRCALIRKCLFGIVFMGIVLLGGCGDFEITDGVLEEYTGTNTEVTIPEGVTEIVKVDIYAAKCYDNDIDRLHG